MSQKCPGDLAQGKMEAGFNLGLSTLNTLGITILTEVNEKESQQKQCQTLTEFNAKTIQDFISLPQNLEPQFLKVQELLTVMVGYAYKFKSEALPLIIGEQVTLLMRHGNIPASASIYALYSMLLCGSKDFESGFFASEVALSMMEAFPNKQFEMRVRNLIYGCVTPWKRLLKDSIAPLKKGFAVGLEVGDIEYTSYGIFHYINFIYFSETDLSAVVQEIETYSKVLENYKQQGILLSCQIFHQTILNLIQDSATPWQLEGNLFQESKHISDWQASHLDFFLVILYIKQTCAECLV